MPNEENKVMQLDGVAVNNARTAICMKFDELKVTDFTGILALASLLVAQCEASGYSPDQIDDVIENARKWNKAIEEELFRLNPNFRTKQ